MGAPPITKQEEVKQNMGGLISGLLPIIGNLLTGVVSVLVHSLL
ncbi:hypothetical protein OIE68_25300 [Nocardia vinacea]|uniref:Uncharacterized protein n=1 Tax=Nocardia vinacea TaxID=96468 RepID=A0ABZ1Z457_9NOCA|nr:hypothetical protein OIE68_25300 [Nocardia vinacea]